MKIYTDMQKIKDKLLQIITMEARFCNCEISIFVEKINNQYNE